MENVTRILSPISATKSSPLPHNIKRLHQCDHEHTNRKQIWKHREVKIRVFSNGLSRQFIKKLSRNYNTAE